MAKVLLLYEKFIPSVRLCAYEQLNYLAQNGFFELNHCQTDQASRELCENADVVVFVRASTELDLILAKKFKKSNKYIIYVLDDDLLHIENGLASTPYYQMDAVKKRIKKMLGLCDVLVSPSQYLLCKYEGYVKRTIKIEEPCLHIQKAEKKDTKIKIGFAGSPDRNKDINDILENVITKLHNKYKHMIAIEFFGANPYFVEKLNLRYYPYEDSYEKYQEKIASLNWDIGLAPMSSTEFKNCKYYNKYTEYGAIQCIGVYSKVIPYTDIIVDGHNGLLCNNTDEEWLDKLENLIKNSEQLFRIKENIRKDMEVRFSLGAVANDYMKSLPELQYHKSDKISYPLFTFYRKCAKVTRIKEFIMRNKWNTPCRLVEKLVGKN